MKELAGGCVFMFSRLDELLYSAEILMGIIGKRCCVTGVQII